jgi:hypothetical protein
MQIKRRGRFGYVLILRSRTGRPAGAIDPHQSAASAPSSRCEHRKGIAMISVRAREGGTFLSDIVEWWRRLRSRRHCLAELDRFPAGLELLARDVNLSPWDLRAVAAKWPDGDDLLGRRLRTLQLDPELISSAQSYGLRDLERVCTLCGSKRRCERDLVRNAGSADWRDYCLNVATLDALQGRATSGNS